MTEVKGAAVASLSAFLRQEFGDNGFQRWLDSMAPEAKKVYGAAILLGAWYPIETVLSEPINRMNTLFYHGDLSGAWKAGRFAAEYALKGLYSVFVKQGSPEVLIERGGVVIAAYFNPSPIVDIKATKGRGVLKLTQFPDIDRAIEAYIAGWVEHALEISGCTEIKLKITQSLARGDACTEMQGSWKDPAPTS